MEKVKGEKWLVKSAEDRSTDLVNYLIYGPAVSKSTAINMPPSSQMMKSL
jgi:hypothetical protein